MGGTFFCFVLVLALYLSTLAPGMLQGDSAEFQWAMVALGVPHATGYPLFTLLGHLWYKLVPIGSAAYRLNLLAALFGASTVAMVYHFACHLIGHRLPAFIGALWLALSPVFWFNSSILEVYTLNTFFLSLLLLGLWRWGQTATAPDRGSRAASPLLIAIFFLLGLSLAHHRLTLALLPGLIYYVWRMDPSLLRNWRRPAALALALIPGLAFYIYVPLRLLPTGATWHYVLNDIILGRQFAGSLFRVFEPWRILVQIPWENFGWGLVLAVLGVLVLFRDDPHLGALFGITYLADALFALAYWVPDIEVFLTPGFVVVALWIAVGLAELLTRIQGLAPGGVWIRRLGWAVLSLVALLSALWPITRWSAVQEAVAAEAGDVERQARALLTANLPANALLELDWGTATGMRFLQVTEGLRPDLEVRLTRLHGRDEFRYMLQNLESGRPVLLVGDTPISRFPAGYRWQHEANGLLRLEKASRQMVVMGLRVSDELELAGYEPDAAYPALLWRASRPLAGNYATYVEYFDAAGRLLGRQDKAACCEPLYGYETSQWEPGWLMADYYDPWPPSATYLRVGLYQEHAGQAKPYGRAVALQVKPLSLVGMRVRFPALFGGAILLHGCTITKEGEGLRLQLFWESLAPLERDYTVFVHGLDAQGRIVSQADGQPLGGIFPTSAWRPGQVVWDSRILSPAVGVVRLRLGLYYLPAGARLPRSDGPGDFVDIDLDSSP